MDTTAIHSRIIKGSFTVLLFSLLISPLGYLIRILYSHTLTIDEYGLFYALINFITTICIYNDLGYGYSIIYLIPKLIKKQEFAKAWNLYQYVHYIELLTSAAISILLIIFANWIAQNYFHTPLATNLIYIFTIYLITNSLLSAIINLFNGLQQELYYSSVHFVRLFATLILSALLWFFNEANILYFALAWGVGYIITTFIYYFLLRRKNPQLVSNKITWDNDLFRQMSKLALPTLITNSIISFGTFSDTFFLTLFSGVQEVGVYNVIVPIVSISAIFLSPINNFIMPLFSHLMEGERQTASYVLNKSLKIIPFVAAYFSFFFLLFPSSTIGILFGEKWIPFSVKPLEILSVGYIFTSLATYLAVVAAGLGKVKTRMIISIIIAIVSICLNAVLVSRFGITGAVISFSLTSLLSVILFMSVINNTLKFTLPILYYLALVIVATTILIFKQYLYFEPRSLIQYISTGIIYTLIVATLAILFKIVDIRVIKLIIKKGNATNSQNNHK